MSGYELLFEYLSGNIGMWDSHPPEGILYVDHKQGSLPPFIFGRKFRAGGLAFACLSTFPVGFVDVEHEASLPPTLAREVV